jgi:hypothetical protein
MKRKFILALGMFLGSYLSAAAQIPAPRIVAEQNRSASIMAMVHQAMPAPLIAESFSLPGNPAIFAPRTLPAPVLAASLPVHKNPANSAVHFSYMVAEPYKPGQGMDGLENQFQFEEVDTLFLAQSTLPLAQLWGGRMRFEGFASTLNIQNVQLGPSDAGGMQDFRPWRQSELGAPPSVNSYGVSMSFHFGREAQTGRPAQIWQTVARMFGGGQ